MNREILVSISSKLIQKTTFHHLKVDVIFICLISIIEGLSAYLCFLTHNNAGYRCWFYGAFTLILPLAFVFQYYSIYIKRMNEIHKMKTPVFKYRLMDEELDIEKDLSREHYSWKMFNGIRKYKEYWRIVYTPDSFFVFPVEFLDEETKSFLLSKLSAPSPKKGIKKILLYGIIFLYLVYDTLRQFVFH